LKVSVTIFWLLLTSILVSSFDSLAQLNKYYFFNQARTQIADEQYTKAISTLNELLGADSKMADAWFLRGLAKYYLNDFQGSIADFSQAISNNPVFSQALLYRGIVYGRLSRFSLAKNDFDMAIDLRPNWPDGYFSRGVNYLLSQEYGKSVQDFSKVIQLEPKNVDAWINRGTANAYSGDTTLALNDYNHAQKLNPFYSETYSKRGKLLLEIKNYELALNDLTKAVEFDSTSSINYFLRALAYNYLDSSNRAIIDLSRSIYLSPSNALSIYNRALLLWQTGRTSDAITDFNRVSVLNPENVLVYYNRGLLFYEQDKYFEAIADFSRAIQIFPDFSNAYRARAAAYAQLGNQYQSQMDRRYAMSIAERYSESKDQPLTDTSSTFNNLVAFSSDFSPRTSIPLPDELASKPVDILPFIRVVLVKSTELKLLTQGFAPIDTLNKYLIPLGYGLTFSSQNKAEDFEIPNIGNEFVKTLIEAISLSTQKRYNQAIEKYKIAQNLEPNNPIVTINLAAELADMVNFIASFEKDHNSISLGSSQAQTNTSGFLANIQKDSFQESIELLNSINKNFSKNSIVNYNLANIFALANEISTATQLYSKAIEIEPTLSEAWYNRGLIHFMQKDYNAGCTDMGKAGELGTRQAYLLIHRFCRR
jgi:tetratricopeptide (TPR) repeat protein